jgi:Tfp pilus assembly protein PilX
MRRHRGRVRTAGPVGRSERGVSLIVTLLTLTLLTTTGASLAYITSRGNNAAHFQGDAEQATLAAEAGVNAARSVLFNDPAAAASQSALPSAPGTASIAVDGVNVTYWGVLSGTMWTLYGRASVPNPSGADDIVRQVETQVQYTAGSAGTPTSLWDYSLSAVTPGECMTIKNNGVMYQPLRVIGDMCVENNAHFYGPTLQVSGELRIGNNGTVGTSPSATSPVQSVKVQVGCKSANGGGPLHDPCTAADRVYAQSITNGTVSLTKPTVDFAYWYLNASPGPKHPCTTSSGTPPSFDVASDSSNPAVTTPNGNLAGWVDLTPAGSYTCVTATGQLSWDVTSRVLTIAGVIFFDGDVRLTNNDLALYQGRGVIYTYGDFELSNNAALCGARTGTSLATHCTSGWDPSVNALVIVAYHPGGVGFRISNNAKYQGGAYVQGDYEVSNNGSNGGPVIADDFDVQNNAGQYFDIPMYGGVPDWGTPGTSGTPTPASLANVANSYRAYTPSS